MMMTTKIGLNYPEIAEERKLSYDNARMKIGRCLDGARLIHLVLGGRGGSLLVAGQSVTQSESRRAMVWKTCVAPGHSGRILLDPFSGVRHDGSGRPHPQRTNYFFELAVGFTSRGKMVEKVCCWPQARSESAVVDWPSR